MNNIVDRIDEKSKKYKSLKGFNGHQSVELETSTLDYINTMLIRIVILV